jgi:formimidoylglutamase
MALVAPDPKIYFSRKDPKDRRLGEIWNEPAKNPNVVLLGWPDDRGISANKGRPGAAQGPDEIRKALYKSTPGLNGELAQLSFADLGNLKLETSIEKSHESAAEHVAEAIRRGAVPITLGGGNDYAYADVLGLRKGLGDQATIGVINIDAHFDVRDSSNGPNSGTPYFQLLESKVFSGEQFVEFGIQPNHNSTDHYKYVQAKGAQILTLDVVQTRGPAKVFYQCLQNLKKDCSAIYVSLDIDSVRQADAPGCSAPYPNGFTAEDAERFGQLAGDEPAVKMFSIYEVSPPLDRDGQTSALAASIVWRFIQALSRRS